MNPIIEALFKLGRPATLREIAGHLGKNSSYDNEKLWCQIHNLVISKKVAKVPKSELGRDFETKNKGTTKWAYKLTEKGKKDG